MSMITTHDRGACISGGACISVGPDACMKREETRGEREGERKKKRGREGGREGGRGKYDLRSSAVAAMYFYLCAKSFSRFCLQFTHY